MRIRYIPSLVAAVAALSLFLAPVVQAATPLLDNGSTLDEITPYNSAQEITNVSKDAAAYGKYATDAPVDIYKFTAEEDGDKTISLFATKEEIADGAEPVLILMDPTTKNGGSELGLPKPSDDYHSVLLKQIKPDEATNTTERFFTEPALMQQYQVYVDQHITLTKGETYYLVTFDPARKATHYTIYFGDTKNWGFSDVFKHMGTWWKLKTDIFAGSNPYAFNPLVLGTFLFILGMIALVGFWTVQQVFSLSANRSKAASYLLVKILPFSRVVIWVGLWFTIMGGYIMLSKVTWVGIPFVMTIAFIPALISILVETIVLVPQVLKVEVAKKEAQIPVVLRKKLFACFVVTTLSLVTTLVFVTMHLSKI